MFFQNEPGDAPFLDILTFEGNRFTEVIKGEDPVLAPGEQIVSTIKGYYFCPNDQELPSSEQRILVIESVEPTNGAFGNSAGDSFACNIWGDSGVPSMLLWCDYEWTNNPPLSTQFEYCREGKVVNGVQCTIPAL